MLASCKCLYFRLLPRVQRENSLLLSWTRSICLNFAPFLKCLKNPATAPRTKSSRLAQHSSFPAPSSIVSCNTANKTESQIVQNFFCMMTRENCNKHFALLRNKRFPPFISGHDERCLFWKARSMQKKKFFEINFAQLEHREHHGFCSETKD